MAEIDETHEKLHALRKQVAAFYTTRNEPKKDIEFEQVGKLGTEEFQVWADDLKRQATSIFGLFNELADKRNPDIVNPKIEAPMETNYYYHVASRSFPGDCWKLDELFAKRGIETRLIEPTPIAA